MALVTMKDKCKKLKRLREHVAYKYHIPYHPSDCDDRCNNCTCICQKCEEEAAELLHFLDNHIFHHHDSVETMPEDAFGGCEIIKVDDYFAFDKSHLESLDWDSEDDIWDILSINIR